MSALVRCNKADDPRCMALECIHRGPHEQPDWVNCREWRVCVAAKRKVRCVKVKEEDKR